jgi:hypothetical protein
MWSSSHGEGDPAEPVLEVARAASGDLVIIGRRGEDFVAWTLLGSVATRVVEPALALARLELLGAIAARAGVALT